MIKNVTSVSNFRVRKIFAYPNDQANNLLATPVGLSPFLPKTEVHIYVCRRGSQSMMPWRRICLTSIFSLEMTTAWVSSLRIWVTLSFFCVRLVVCANLRQGPRHDFEKGQGSLRDMSLFSLWVKLLFINCDFVFCAAYSRELKRTLPEILVI